MFKKTDIEDVCSLSPMQEGILFHYLLEPGSTAYIIQLDFIVQGSLQPDLVEKSLNRLIQQYDILRTVFMSKKVKKPRQVVLKTRQARLFVRDISSLDQDRQARFLEDFKQNDREKGFNLARDIPLRISVIQSSEQRFHIIWTTHHIIMDGWCLGIISKNLLHTYQALKNGKPLPHEPVIPYKHYIQWLERRDRQEGLAYWKKYLHGYNHRASLPRLQKQPAPDRYERRQYLFSLTPEITAGLTRIARTNKVTVNIVFQTLWGLLLQQYNHTRDVVFGIIVSGRPPEVRGIENMVGLLVNNIPIRVKRDSTRTFSQLVRDIHRREVMSKTHEYLPLAEIQSQSPLKQDIIDHIISFANYPIQEELKKQGWEEALGLKIESTENFEQTTYDFDIAVTPGENISIRFCFNALVYEPQLVEQVSAHFKEITRQVVENPEIDAEQMGKVPETARKELLSRLNRELEKEWNRACKKGNVLQAVLEKSLVRFKYHTAIEYGNHCITYEELEKRSNYIAHWFLARGIPRETFTGILIEDRMEIITIIMGILKAGHVFVPLETKHPVDRLKQMIDSAGIPLVVADINNFNRFGTLPGVEFIPAEELFGNKNSSWCSRVPEVVNRPKDIIYIYFTSGTTGTPRAFAGMNTGLLHFIQWEIRTFGIGEGFRVSQLISPGFDAFLRDIFAPLAAGGVICIPRTGEAISSPRQLVRWLESSGVNLVHCGPGLFRVMNSHPLTRENFKELQYILLSGEPVIPHELTSWYAIFGDRIKLVNLWGTSETTLAKTCYFIQPADVHREKVPVGKPLPGAGVVVMDEQMNLYPPLVCGDLYIITPFRTHGYCNAPGLNRQQFIPNPFNPGRQYTWHKTGDFGRILMDGNIDVIGRTDRQVKIRGIRVELAEIESIIMKHPILEEAVVIKKEITADNTCIYGYVTLDHKDDCGEELLLSDINAYLSRKLPDYMTPAKIIIMNEIPRNPNGKVNYDELPDPLLQEEKEDYIRPHGEIEMKLAQLWSEILGIKKISVHHHFFQLGGNSLNVLSLISKIHREFDIRISLGEIFNHPTLEKQAEIIRESKKEKFFTLEHSELKEYYEMSTAQEGIYFQQQIHPTSVSYNMPSVVELEGRLEPDKLEKIFIKLIHRHESLRTSFIIIGEKPFQVIGDRVEFEIAHYHLKGNENPGDQPNEEEIQRIIDRFVQPFDLTCAPLMRVGLIKLEPTRYILTIDFHHIISDGISNEIFVNESIALYNGEKLPDLRHQYKDYSEWQNRRKKAGILKRQEEFWLKEFERNVPPIHLPLDFKRPGKRSFEGDSLDFYIGPGETAALKNIALEENATIFILLMAVYNVFLAKISGQEDITVGTVIAGRMHENTREIIGLFVNLLALRNLTPEDMSFRNFLRRVREKTLKTFENQDYPFEQLVAKLKLSGDSSRNPIFSAAFDELVNTTPRSGNPHPVPPVLTIKPYFHGGETSKFDLLLRSIVRSDTIMLKFQYLTTIFKKDTIQRFIKYFKEIVAQVVEHPDRKLREISISHGLITAGSSTLNDYKSDFAL